MARVNMRSTPLSQAGATEALAAAWGRLCDSSPNANQMALLLAQTALETGRWQQLWNYNFGNLIAGSSSGTAWWDGDWYEADDSGNLRQFRAYGSAEEGATDYVALLLRRPSWAQALDSGQPEPFARALKHGEPVAYYEAPLERYSDTLTELWEAFGGQRVERGPRKLAAVGAGAAVLGLAYLWARGRL